MDSGFIIAIVAVCMGAWVVTTWIRAKHGYPLEDWSGFGKPIAKGDIDAERKVALLTSDNERLAGQVSRLEERIAVLERIATDPAERTRREIDALHGQ